MSKQSKYEDRLDRIEKLILFLIEWAKNTGAFAALATDDAKQHAETLAAEHSAPEEVPTAEKTDE